VKQTIEMHGGTISLSPTPGGGATFQVRLRSR
jgi:signal transduction histidine kinase